jgi:hypothetical protein
MRIPIDDRMRQFSRIATDGLLLLAILPVIPCSCIEKANSEGSAVHSRI